MILSNRGFFLLIVIGGMGLLSFGYYLEFYQDLLPCPMCILQRLCYGAIIVVALAAAIQGPARAAGIFYCAGVAILASLGAVIAGRQTWLQHLPPELVPECGPGLEFMLEMYPLRQAIEKALMGTGDCADVSWTFLSLSIAEWSLACFSGIIFAALWQLMVNWGHTDA
ncbi:MAG TPA: disulfide bond formation protein B [Gammaproteobacteria bacterium]|nr:disulfide bond formation protein B [Gammaproteobacteria bacterium]